MKHGCVFKFGCGCVCECMCGTRPFLRKYGVGAANKKLLKIFIFIFSIYCKGKNIFLLWESMQTTNDNKYISLLGKHANKTKCYPFLYIFYLLSFSFQIYFQRKETKNKTQNKKENTKEATNIQNKIEKEQI